MKSSFKYINFTYYIKLKIALKGNNKVEHTLNKIS